MKKYVKPELFYERFELAQQIATCQYDSNNTHSDRGCQFTGYNEAWQMEMTIFLPGSNCTMHTEDYCYHGSTGTYNIFNS